MRGSTKAGIAIVAVGLGMAGVTTISPPEGAPPAVQEELVPETIAVHSSTRGAVPIPLDGSSVGGVPFDPGGQAEAANALSEQSPVVVREGSSAPAVPESSAESVIGSDGRTWLRHQTEVFPNSAIGRIDFRQDGVSYWCTGTLIDADTVLTAGHCVHDGISGGDGWSTRVKFTPGAEGNRAPFGSCASVELLTVPGWYDGGSEYQDLGLIELDCEIGETVGWFGYRPVPGLRGLVANPVHVRGYPGDKVWSSLWTMRDRVRVSQARMAFYASDTYGGQSGSPVFDLRPCNGSRGPCILAVHAYGAHPGGAHSRYNHGPRLDEQRVALIAALAAA